MKNKKTFTIIGFSDETLCKHVVDVLNSIWVYEGVNLSYHRQDDRRLMVTAQVGHKENFKIREENVNVMNAQAYAIAASYTRLAEAANKKV